jgi:hypothetical protein
MVTAQDLLRRGHQDGPDRRRGQDLHLVPEAGQAVSGGPFVLERLDRVADIRCQRYRRNLREMITWSEFERRQPALASAGRGQFYQFGIGLGFLATVRPGERSGQVWPGFDQEAVFELTIERCLMVLTQPDAAFPAGPTIWKAGNTPPSAMVT